MVKKIKKIFSPIEILFQNETLASFLLCVCAVVAMVWANSRHANLYQHIVHLPLSVNFGAYIFKTTLYHIINDGLMTLFFFIVGLEIKRELFQGEMSSPRKAAFPIIAAIGGMIVPAFIYYILNKDTPGERGWGIPMATDIAFAVGILGFMSRKVPFSLKIFLLSLAIIDDIGAVLVMALYYSQSISGQFLSLAILVAFVIFIKFKMGIRSPVAFGFLSLALWICFYHSGVHATLSGILLGFLVPSKRFFSSKQIIESVKKGFSKENLTLQKVNRLKSMVKDAHSPLHRLLSIFHPYVNFIILPSFAFFNAGVSLSFISIESMVFNSVNQGVLLGLVLGKPIGILLFSFLGVSLGLSKIPKYVTWKQITAVSFLAGIGFTMSLFIESLSFEQFSNISTQAKASILFASCLAALTGLIMLFVMKSVPKIQRTPEASNV